MARGFVYLTVVVDVASRRVLTHKVAITLEACHAREILEDAFARYGTPEIVNTDQCSQFTATEFTDCVLTKNCKLSMDGRGAWRDNVLVERLWRSVKYERVHLKAYASISAARTDIADYLNWYNTQRPHSSLDRITPGQAYLNMLHKMTSLMRPELQAATCSFASFPNRPDSTYKSGKVVQTNGATSARSAANVGTAGPFGALTA